LYTCAAVGLLMLSMNNKTSQQMMFNCQVKTSETMWRDARGRKWKPLVE